ncbi:MAG TPA: ATP-binding protein [Actinomycetota bacterium]|nr:ATP-binding protein [Actinomycetota bacterium]
MSHELIRRTRSAAAGALRRIRGSSPDEAERLEAALRLVLAASHDFKTPLTGLYGWTRTLRYRWRTLPDAQREEVLDRMLRQLAGLSRTLDNVLATARLGTVPAARPLDIRDAVHAAVREVLMLDPEREVVTVVPEHSVEVLADHARLGRILANLLDNAVKYSPADAPVTIRLVEDGAEVRVEVEDRGPGLDRVEIREIFDPHVRTGVARRSGARGTGLGLFLARSFAHDLGGDLLVRSRLGEGSTFALRLPRE